MTIGISEIDNGNTIFAVSYGRKELQEKVENYIAAISTSTTTEFCSCEWDVHPDDVGKENGRRMRMKDEDSICPLHTMEGRILYFFTWLSTNG